MLMPNISIIIRMTVIYELKKLSVTVFYNYIRRKYFDEST